MFTTYDYAIFRCFYGFFCGAITYLVTAKIRHRVAAPAWVFLIVEAMTLLACFAFVSDAGASPRSMWAPAVFAIAVAVFSFEKGRISALLTKWPFQLLGEISYTLYISHAFILDIMKGLFRTLQQKTAYISVVHYGSEGNPVELLRPASEWASNAVDVGILLLILVLSVVVNRWVEIPCRDYFGRVAKRFQRPRATAPSGGAGLGAADSDPAAARAG